MELKDIKFDKRNYRRHDDKNKELIKKSIEEVGYGRSIVIDADNEVVCGNGVLSQTNKKTPVKVIETDGNELIVVKRTDLKTDDLKRKQLAVMDNSASDSSDFDLALLQEDFDEETLADWGIDIEFEDDEKKETIEDEIPEEVETRCNLGDIWQLGNHRLLCGDCTNEDNVKQLLNGEKSEIAFTSPPYNAEMTVTEQKMSKKSKYIHNEDNMPAEDYLNLLINFTENTLKYSDFSFVNIQSLANNKIAIIDWLHKMKNKYADTMIWDKINGQPAMAKNVLNSCFEYIYIFSNKTSRAIGVKDFRGTLDNIIHIGKQTKNEFSKIHNATFPMELACYFVENFSNNSVLDLFGGSGTTLIACEQLGRKCFMMELDARYCDLIIQRWENFTNKKAVKL